jgi:protein gp37
MANRIAGMERKKIKNGTPNFQLSTQYNLVINNGRWTGETCFITDTLKKPSNWKKKRIIFVCSMGDLFHENIPFKWIDDVMSAICMNYRHIFIILTKRPERALEYYNSRKIKLPALNIWFGVTAENQKTANQRIPYLNSIPAKVKFVSVEPMLSFVNLSIPLKDTLKYHEGGLKNCISWVICGGESGPKARPLHPDWARSLRNQCKESGIPFFLKQWGEWLPWEYDAQPPFIKSQNGQFIDSHRLNIINPETGNTSKDWDDGIWTVIEGLPPCCFQKVGKKSASNLLDGIRHEEYPKILESDN